MSGRKRTLLEELADLTNPAPKPELDPDAADADIPELNDLDDELLQVAATRPSRHAGEKALRLRGDISLEDDAYQGRRSSRAAVFDDDAQLREPAALLADDNAGTDDGEEDEDASSLGDIEDVGDAGDAGSMSEDDAADGDVHTDDEAIAAPAANGHLRRAADASAQADDDDNDAELLSDDAPDEEGGSEMSSEEPSTRDAALHGSRVAAVADQDPEMLQLEREYEQLQQEDAAAMVTLRQRSVKERTKGLAVQHQQILWERGLEMRILLQKCIAGGNRLPLPADRPAAVAASPELANAYDELLQGCRATILELTALRAALIAQNPAVAVAAQAAQQQQQQDDQERLQQQSASKKRSRQGADEDAVEDGANDNDNAGSHAGLDSGALWRRLEAQEALFAPFRDASLDRWHRRTLLSSGKAALRSNLRAINQSVSGQVAALMRDGTRAVQRVQLPASARPRPLCSVAGAAAAAAGTEEGAGGDEERRQRLLLASLTEAQEDSHEARDPETFDDGEFYQQLLKEFLDGRGGDGASSSGMLRPAQKKRRNVDRKASKGRKLRYNVQDKLVNFMTAVEMTPPPFAAQLFANLFGHTGK